MSEPTAISAAAVKLGVSLGAGVLGALIMAAFDPPATKRELFKQAACAGVGSAIFGPVALKFAAYYVPFVDFAQMEYAIPVLFLTGAISWGAFGALAKFRDILRRRGGKFAADKVLGQGPQDEQ